MDIDKTLRNTALLAARLALGGTLAAHGAQKLFGAFDGPGPDKAAQMMHSLGFRPGERFATAASATELTAGTLISIGAFGPIGPALLVSVMLVAIETVHRAKGYWNSGGGYEMNVMYLALALVLANEGYGSFSFDGLTGLGQKTASAACVACGRRRGRRRNFDAFAANVFARNDNRRNAVTGEIAEPRITRGSAS